jgi:phosphoglycolate phosphatase
MQESARMLYQSVFLDFDGVLVESAAIKAKAFQALYREYGPDVVARVATHHKANEGISRLVKIRHCHQAFLGIALSDRELAELGETYTAQVEDRVATCDDVAGARDFLESHHRDIPLFVVSGTPEDEVRRIAERRKITGYFVEVRGSPLGKEDILRDLLDRHGLMPDGALFVGDAMADWDAATACGVDFLGRVSPGDDNRFPAGTRTVPDLTTLGTVVRG